jgi:hypothetical protein
LLFFNPSDVFAVVWSGHQITVSLPTLLADFARYRREQSFAVPGQHWLFLLVMAAGSMLGTFGGGPLLRIVPTWILLPLLAAVLIISAVKCGGVINDSRACSRIPHARRQQRSQDGLSPSRYPSVV